MCKKQVFLFNILRQTRIFWELFLQTNRVDLSSLGDWEDRDGKLNFLAPGNGCRPSGNSRPRASWRNPSPWVNKIKQWKFSQTFTNNMTIPTGGHDTRNLQKQISKSKFKVRIWNVEAQNCWIEMMTLRLCHYCVTSEDGHHDDVSPGKTMMTMMVITMCTHCAAPCDASWAQVSWLGFFFIARPPYLTSMGLDDDPIHKDLHADEGRGDGMVWWWIAELCKKKHWIYIWTDYQSFDLIEALAKLWCVSQWRQNGTTMSWGTSTSPHTHSCAPHMCTAIVHKKSKLWHEGPRILIHCSTHTQIQLPGLHIYPILVILLGTCAQQVSHNSHLHSY